MISTPKKTSKEGIALKQPEVSTLVRELRQLLQWTQAQLASELGVAYETINRWENGHMQPSALALKQLRILINQLNNSPSKALQDGSRALLQKYFDEKRITKKDSAAFHQTTEKST